MEECIICGEETDKGRKNFATGEWIYLCCRDCDDEYDHQRWRAEYFEAQEYGNNCDDCGGFLKDCIGHTDGESCNQAGVETRLCSKCGDGPRCDSCRKIYDYYGGDDPYCNVCDQMVPYNPISNVGESHKRWCKWDAGAGQTAGTCETCWSEPWMWSNDLGYVFFDEDSPYNNSDYERMCLHCMEDDFPEVYGHLVNQPAKIEPIPKKWWQFWKSESFEAETFHSNAISRQRPKKITDRVMQQQLMLAQAELSHLDLRLEANVRLGIITPEQADRIMMEAASKFGLAAEDLGDDVDWDREDPPAGDWAEAVDWTVVQAAQAYDYLMSLAEGDEGTEFESNFLLDEYYMGLLRARLGSQMEGIQDMEGFGEGPYPVPIAILTPNEICTQTELQLHTVFEAYESVMEGLPDHDEDDHDHDDDDDHDEFETIINLYSPYQDATYEVLVRTADGNLIEGPFEDLVVAQEVVDDWNAPGYEPVATLRRRPHQNGAYRGLSRVVFEDGSYLTFLLLGDLTQRQGDYINMTSVFLFPRAHGADSGWWESHSNN